MAVSMADRAVINDEFDSLLAKMACSSSETGREVLAELAALSPIKFQLAGMSGTRAGGTDVALESKIESYL